MAYMNVVNVYLQFLYNIYQTFQIRIQLEDYEKLFIPKLTENEKELSPIVFYEKSSNNFQSDNFVRFFF